MKGIEKKLQEHWTNIPDILKKQLEEMGIKGAEPAAPPDLPTLIKDHLESLPTVLKEEVEKIIQPTKMDPPLNQKLKQAVGTLKQLSEKKAAIQSKADAIKTQYTQLLNELKETQSKIETAQKELQETTNLYNQQLEQEKQAAEEPLPEELAAENLLTVMANIGLSATPEQVKELAQKLSENEVTQQPNHDRAQRACGTHLGESGGLHACSLGYFGSDHTGGDARVNAATWGAPADDAMEQQKETTFPGFCGGVQTLDSRNLDDDIDMQVGEPHQSTPSSSTCSSLDFVVQNLQCRSGNFRNRCFANGPFRLWAWAGSFMQGAELWQDTTSAVTTALKDDGVVNITKLEKPTKEWGQFEQVECPVKWLDMEDDHISKKAGALYGKIEAYVLQHLDKPATGRGTRLQYQQKPFE